MIAFTLDPTTVVQIVLTILMPIAVGLVTAKTASSSIKSWLLAGLTVLASTLTELATALANDTTFDMGIAILAAVPAFAISVSTYYGLWKPTGVAGKAQSVEKTTLIR